MLPTVGGGEILLLLVVALLIFGPKRLPEMARQLGKGVRDFKQAATGTRDELGFSLDDDESEPARPFPNE
jgi:sec-independent protein translocase protein TatA